MPRTRRRRTSRKPKEVETIRHADATRPNLPSAEHQSLMGEDEQSPVQVAYERRNRDLDPQLVWRGKDEQDASDLVVQAPPLYIQERVHPKVLVDDLMQQSQANRDAEAEGVQEGFADLFADFNGLPSEDAKTEFYQHDANWSNRMILGDSLQVMSSLAEREGLRGKVQCIYLDPPYGIRFNSNFQWSTTTREVRNETRQYMTKEPEQVKAFRDTWRDGIHSYMTYLRDRFMAAREMLSFTGSVFVQIGIENVHRVRALMDEVFGDENFVNMITFTKTSPLGSKLLVSKCDYIIWFAKDKEQCKYRPLFVPKPVGEGSSYRFVELLGGTKRTMTIDERKDLSKLPSDSDPFIVGNLLSTGYTQTCYYDFEFEGRNIPQGRYSWKTTFDGMKSLMAAGRVWGTGTRPGYVQKYSDFPVKTLDHLWDDVGGAHDRRYVVETNSRVVERCLLMTTDPGDLVLDPTCGSGTTAYVAEQWGRRWITIDTSRVALALARARIMGSRHAYYLLSDSDDGKEKEAEVTRTVPSSSPTFGDIRHGFVYDRVPHITLRDIANNAEIDVIWEEYQAKMEPVRTRLNDELGTSWEEWEIPRELEQMLDGGGTANLWFRFTPSGGICGSNVRRRSMPRSRQRQNSSICMTSRMRIGARCVWQDRSRWSRSRRIG